MRKLTPLEPGESYHIYSDTIADCIAFKSDRNYSYFQQQFIKILLPIAQTYAYSFLPDEYHFVLKINDTKRLRKFFPSVKSYPHFLSRQIGRFTLSYTNAFNNEQNRKGSLFRTPFSREKLLDEFHIINTIRKIHMLPVEKNLCSMPEQWRHSSYNRIINNQPSLVAIDSSKWFTTMDKYIKFHEDYLINKAA